MGFRMSGYQFFEPTLKVCGVTTKDGTRSFADAQEKNRKKKNVDRLTQKPNNSMPDAS
jgi:hypothetical protein